MALRTGAHRFGDWDVVGKLTNHLQSDIEKAGAIAAKQAGLKAERLAIKWIHKQPSTWPPLAPETLARKKGRGKTLIHTNTYVSHITSYAVNGHQVFAGVRRKVLYGGKDGDGGSVADVAAVLEYGSEARNIPARPTWRPVYAQMKRWIPQSGLFRKAMQNQIRGKYRPRSRGRL